MALIKFAKHNPYFISTSIDEIGFKSNDDWNKYYDELFKDQPQIDGGVSYRSWNQIDITLTYTEDIWNQLSQINYIELTIINTTNLNFYIVDNYQVIQNKKITLNCRIDSLFTYWKEIKFKTNASAYIDRLHINRWKETTAVVKDGKYYLSPNWDKDSPLWQSDEKMQIDNKIEEEIIPLENNINEAVNFEKTFNPFIKGQFIYFIMKYNDNKETTSTNYRPWFDSTGLNFVQINPMPYWIIPLPSVNEDKDITTSKIVALYNKLIASPFLQSIEYSFLPWGLLSYYDSAPPEKPNGANQPIKLTDWKSYYAQEQLPQTLLDDGEVNWTYAIRADLIHSYMELPSPQFKEIITLDNKINKLGYLKDKNKFSVLNEPKLFMYPYFELNFIRGKRLPLIIHNERLLSGEDINKPIEILIKFIFTCYMLGTYHVITTGLYNTSLTDNKYSINTSNSNTLVSLSSNFQNFLNQHLSSYYTGLYGAKINRDLNYGTAITGAIAGAAGGAAAGSFLPGIGTAVGAAIGGAVGLFTGISNATKSIVNNDINVSQQKNILTDLARQPDTTNQNSDFDSYTDISILFNQMINKSYFISSIRIKTLTDYNKEQVALWFHKFGYPVNKNLVIDNWDKLLLRESWNYIQIEQFNDIIDLQSSKIPWKALEEIAEKFRQGIRIWIWNENITENINNYNLPNWENNLIFPALEPVQLTNSKNDISGLPRTIDISKGVTLTSSNNDFDFEIVKKGK